MLSQSYSSSNSDLCLLITLWYLELRLTFFICSLSLVTKSLLVWTIRGLSRKYQAYFYISALALFFIIGRVAPFKVFPTWLNNTVPAMFPLLETVLELTFRDDLEYARRIIFNRRFVIESLPFEWFFEFWKQPKVTGGYVGTVRMLWKQCDSVFTQKLLHKIRWMRWRVIVVKKPVTAHTRVIPKILFKISQTVVFGIPRLFSSSRTVNRRSPSIASRTRSIYPMFLSSKVGQNENHYQQKYDLLKNDYTTLLFVFFSYTHSQRSPASSE